MPSAAALRLQIEAALADRIPSALTPAPRVLRPTAPTGIPALDAALNGGFPLGAITELSGPECSGRTSVALSFLARLTQDNRVCAWIDVSDALHPESAAAAGVDLARLLWIRCGPEAEQLTLPGFSDKDNPRVPPISPVLAEVGEENLSSSWIPRCSEPVPTIRKKSREAVPLQPVTSNLSPAPSSELCALRSVTRRKPWSALDQALRAADLLLNAGGFSALVLDMGSVVPEFALRVPLATWFRYRAAAERCQAAVLLLTRQPCTQSSAGLVLRCEPGSAASDATTVLTGIEHRVAIACERFAPSGPVANITRKPPQSDHSILCPTRTPWSAPYSAKAGRP